jgi:hypothetical protein
MEHVIQNVIITTAIAMLVTVKKLQLKSANVIQLNSEMVSVPKIAIMKNVASTVEIVNHVLVAINSLETEFAKVSAPEGNVNGMVVTVLQRKSLKHVAVKLKN